MLGEVVLQTSNVYSEELNWHLMKLFGFQYLISVRRLYSNITFLSRAFKIIFSLFANNI